MKETAAAARTKIGDELRRYRELTGLTQKQLAKTAAMSQSHVSSIEVGSRGVSEEQITQIDRILGAKGSLASRWRALFRGGGLPAWFSDVAELQSRAAQISEYQMALIPGLLQIPEYAETLLRFGRPYDTAQQIKEHVAARMHRREILQQDEPPWYVVVLDEPWLHRPVGTRAIMKDQLEHLLKAAQLPRVTIQVVPMNTRTLAGIDGSFQLIAVPNEGGFVFTESRNRGHVSGDPDHVQDHTRIFGELRGAALPEEDSTDLIRRIAQEEYQ